MQKKTEWKVRFTCSANLYADSLELSIVRYLDDSRFGIRRHGKTVTLYCADPELLMSVMAKLASREMQRGYITKAVMEIVSD